MSAHPLPLCTPTLDSRLPPHTYPVCGLSAVGCKLPLPPETFSGTLARPVTPKSFIRNAYKKHGGWGMPVGQPILAVRLTWPVASNYQLSTFNLFRQSSVAGHGPRITPP
jgi:hypothetical protein